MDLVDQNLQEYQRAEQARGDASRWLADFETALGARDAGHIAALFHEDSHWRDILAFTWYYTPIVGAQFVNQAHLHFGQKHTTGGITVWLCQSADSPAPAAVAAVTPICPSPSGTVSGTILPGQVLALPGQGLPAGQGGFDALLEALQNDAIYGNVHTDKFPSGEIRGQFADHDDD